MPEPLFGAHGHIFTIGTSDHALTQEAWATFATLRVEEDGPATAYWISRDRTGMCILHYEDELVGNRPSSGLIMQLLQWHINRHVIHRSCERRPTLHAAAAQSPDGEGVVLAAPMEAGKTTTVTGLLLAGWDFLTDEAAALDADGTIHAYPKPLTIDSGSWHLFPALRPAVAVPRDGSWLVPATSFGTRVVARAPLRLIVLPRYGEGESTEASRITTSAATLALAHSDFEFNSHGGRDLPILAGLARKVPAFRLTIGSLDAAVEVIDELVSQCSDGYGS